ncbi:glutamate synthase large subunit [Patulibacter sp. NPDC049589]|uniref:glutamate synthase large subunit n=1 Tax=Patulibacter sp. NPDC049589 TaxID=3154731 RepID=UPI003411FAC9
MTRFTRLPAAQGLYDPRNEHDACGVAMVARLDNVPQHETLVRALTALENLDHRGAAGADARTGDGAGILVQIPHEFLRAVVDFELPEPGSYAVGMCFLPRDATQRRHIEEMVERNVRTEGQRVLGWRDVPVREEEIGVTANAARPYFRQIFIEAGPGFDHDQEAFERKLYVIRRICELATPDFYASTFSSRTLVYKGMLLSAQVPAFFPDLQDERFKSAIALVHSRFSTNTFPSWDRAHPNRVIAHNGEINTLRGNINWMRARESQLGSHLFGGDIGKIKPVVRPGGSDSATFDNVLELLMLAGRSLPHAVMMMVPEAYEGRDDLTPELAGFYAYHSLMMEPWDGPAAVLFTDGRTVGATLDRNGLRPGRWAQTKDGWIILGSEAGMLDIHPSNIERLGRLAPGQLFLVDLEQHRVVSDEEIKKQVATQRPYEAWHRDQVVHFSDLEKRTAVHESGEHLRQLQQAFGYTQEDERVLLTPMASGGAEPIGSMGNDAALAVLSDKRPPLFSYFKQLFAQVTNPPIDPIREDIVMSLSASIGGQKNLLEETPEHAHHLVLKHPILRNDEMETLRQVDQGVFKSHTIDITWPVADGPDGIHRRIADACDEAYDAIQAGRNVLILSDRAASGARVAIPSLLAVAAVHHHLVREGVRLEAGLVIESAEPREVHHFATLLGYGAAAINPYLMFDTVDDLVAQGRIPGVTDAATAQKNVVKAIGKGLLKAISKMGISTIASYSGAQIFEAVGLHADLIDRFFTGTASRIGGVGLEVLAQETLERHARAWILDAEHDPTEVGARVEALLPVGGMYSWRRDGEHHMWNPTTISLLQHAVRVGDRDKPDDDARAKFREFSDTSNGDATRKATLRGLMAFNTDGVEPIPLEEVEPASAIVKRFVTGAMSLGSISTEAHENLAIAMNRLGGRSNTGEGGEDPRRFTPEANGDRKRSSIKQVASGRFGVTSHYLANADQLQIKMAQGAKPGEGGQLPGHKVDKYIGSVRHTTPGVGLISPPPHHDIYSIEDLKQLIYDLRCGNPEASVSVKLVSEVGVGTIASGVAKAGADHIVVAGHDGGTGASPLSSIVSAGVPWEIGLAETQQTLLLNDLRSRVRVQTDGQLKTGRDVVIAALLGADEMGFSTAPLIATGCIMMRACHLNTCPVGIATQDPELRKRFKGTPEHVVNFFLMVAEQVREILAELGARTIDEIVGKVELLQADEAVDHWKARGVDLANLFHRPEIAEGATLYGIDPQLTGHLDDHLDWKLLPDALPAVERREPVQLTSKIRNVDRCVGGIISSRIATAQGIEGLAEGTLKIAFSGSAGQSFGGWLAPGVEFSLSGDANDYTGKGLSGGVLSVTPPESATYVAEDNQIVGNTVLYGATEGRAFFRGRAGERFAVRNSGASTVVEGVGDHGCEYMTGGRVVVLGEVGRNFGAGMSGGFAFVLDEQNTFRRNVNPTIADQLEGPDEADLIELRDLIAEHRDRTGSAVAERVLGDWEHLSQRFVKVFPADYRRVLEQLAREEAAVGARAAKEETTEAVGAPQTTDEEKY